MSNKYELESCKPCWRRDDAKLRREQSRKDLLAHEKKVFVAMTCAALVRLGSGRF
jgi:hypothetical protein